MLENKTSVKRAQDLPVEEDAEASFGREETTFKKVELVVILVEEADARGIPRRRPHGLVSPP